MSELDRRLWAARAQLLDSNSTVELPATQRAAAFSDDLWIGPQRLLVRAFIKPGTAGSLAVDLRDSSAAIGATGCIDEDDVRFAAACAVADALGEAPTTGLARAIEIDLDPATWVGAPTPTDDACARLFAISRVYDAVAGALALAWPDRSRAGSCSLGAIVMGSAVDGDEHLLAVIPGGRGANVDGPGESAWPGPLLPGGAIVRSALATLELSARPDSGGGGARSGGDGTGALIRVAAPMRLRIAIDRLRNPPHGLDRAGPPEPATLVRRAADGTTAELTPWQWTTFGPGESVHLATAGGAGHGFGGYGIDVDWE